jgi:hypothetical protein
MSHIDSLIKRPKRTLGLLVLVLIAVGVAIGSGADFSAQSANPSNTFAAGTLTMSNSANNAAILTASNMKPGDTATGTVDIANTGSLQGAFSVSWTALTDTPSSPALSGKLDLVVHDCGLWSGGNPPSCSSGGSDVYSSTLSAMSSAVALGNYAAGDKHRFKFTVTLNSSADNSYQGGQSNATFTWNAVQ